MERIYKDLQWKIICELATDDIVALSVTSKNYVLICKEWANWRIGPAGRMCYGPRISLRENEKRPWKFSFGEFPGVRATLSRYVCYCGRVPSDITRCECNHTCSYCSRSLPRALMMTIDLDSKLSDICLFGCVVDCHICAVRIKDGVIMRYFTVKGRDICSICGTCAWNNQNLHRSGILHYLHDVLVIDPPKRWACQYSSIEETSIYDPANPRIDIFC